MSTTSVHAVVGLDCMGNEGFNCVQSCVSLFKTGFGNGVNWTSIVQGLVDWSPNHWAVCFTSSKSFYSFYLARTATSLFEKMSAQITLLYFIWAPKSLAEFTVGTPKEVNILYYQKVLSNTRISKIYRSTQASQKSFVLSQASFKRFGCSDVTPSCQRRQMVALGCCQLAQNIPKQYKLNSYKTEIGSPSGAPRLEEWGFEKEPLCFKLYE